MKTTNLPSCLILVFAPFLALTAACPADQGKSCDSVPACGGDIVGTWKVTDSCVSFAGDGSRSFCPRLPLSLDLSVDGTVTYGADKTYQQTGTFTFEAELHFPTSCLTIAGTTMTCDQLATYERTTNPVYQSLTCRAESAGCACTGQSIDLPADESGTWTTSGNVLTSTHDGKSESSPYCVTGASFYQSATGLEIEGLEGTGSITQVKQ